MNTNLINFSRHFLMICGCAFLVTLASCSKDDDDNIDCTGLAPTYTQDVKAILDASCAVAGCHDAITVQSGVNLSSFATAFTVSREERFLGVIQHRSGFTPMPFGGSKLPDATIQILTCWVESGSPQ